MSLAAPRSLTKDWPDGLPSCSHGACTHHGGYSYRGMENRPFPRRASAARGRFPRVPKSRIEPTGARQRASIRSARGSQFWVEAALPRPSCRTPLRRQHLGGVSHYLCHLTEGDTSAPAQVGAFYSRGKRCQPNELEVANADLGQRQTCEN